MQLCKQIVIEYRAERGYLDRKGRVEPMDWREGTIYTTTEGIGPVEALLEDNGVEGYVLERCV